MTLIHRIIGQYSRTIRRFQGARVPFSPSLRERARNGNSSQAARARHSLNAVCVEHWRACAYPKQQRRVQPLDRSNWRSTAIGRSGLTPARIHPPRSRPKAIPGLSISAESTAATAKVATIEAQNCHWPYPNWDPKNRTIGIWTR